jgi:hypothetical protein
LGFASLAQSVEGRAPVIGLLNDLVGEVAQSVRVNDRLVNLDKAFTRAIWPARLDEAFG